MQHRAVRQRQLFEDNKALNAPQLQDEVRQQATRLLVQWMQALAQVVGAEASDEQDQR